MKLQDLCKENFPGKKIIYLYFSRNFSQKMTLEEKIQAVESKILEVPDIESVQEAPTKDVIYMMSSLGKAIFICQGELAFHFAEKYGINLVSEGVFFD